MSTPRPVSTELLQKVQDSSYADLHPAVMDAVAAGAFTIVDLLDNIPWFRGAPDWTAWRAFLCAVYALPMTDQEFAIYQHCTGRKRPPTEPAREVWVPTGRRARKSAIAALIAVFEGGFRDYTKYLAPGEVAVIPLIGKNMEEAVQIATYCKAILSDESLSHLLAEEPLTETIHLIGSVDIRIRPASITAGRGKTIPCALLDEVAFFHTEGAVPDIEVVRGIRPGMATVPQAKLMGFSSPFGQRGLLWENFKEHYGKDHPGVLVWKADTIRMHDTPQLRAMVQVEYQRDAVSAAAEYGADFREDTAAFILERILDALIVQGRREVLPGARGPQNYFAFVDPSGGSADSMTLAIAHFEHAAPLPPAAPHEPGETNQEVTFEQLAAVMSAPPSLLIPGKVVLDLIEEWRAPFDPNEVTRECADKLKGYGLFRAVGDKYGGRWPWSGFRQQGIAYMPSARPKSEIYRDCLPILNAGQAELLDYPRLKAQFLELDRNVARGGRETIDHAPGGHDDVANAVAGALLMAQVLGSRMRPPKVSAAPAQTVQELHKRRIAEALEKAKVKPHARGNPWRR